MTSTKSSLAVDTILETLGRPETDTQGNSLTAFFAEDYQQVKTIAAANLDDNFCKTMAYLSSAMNPAAVANLATILAEASRSAADYVGERERKKAIEKMQQANRLTLLNY